MKVSEAIPKVALNMSLINGAGMSQFADDQLQNYLSNAHDMLVEKYVWPELVSTFFKTLDGTTGKATIAFAPADGFLNYRQIKHVYSSQVYRELPLVSGSFNPLMPGFQVGYSIINTLDDPSKQYIIKISPPTTTGDIAIVVNRKADFTNPDTVIPIDDLIHIWIATWMYAEDDATNPAQAEKYFNLWQDRIKDIRTNVNIGPYALNPFNGPNQTWWEYGYPA